MASVNDSMSFDMPSASCFSTTEKKKTTILLCMAVGRRKHHHDERRGLGNGSRPSALTLPRNAISTRERRFQIVDLAGEPSESLMEGFAISTPSCLVLESAISGPNAPVFHQSWRSWSLGGCRCACSYLQGWRRADRGSCFPGATRMCVSTNEQLPLGIQSKWDHGQCVPSGELSPSDLRRRVDELICVNFQSILDLLVIDPRSGPGNHSHRGTGSCDVSCS
jgi:hypothetical protein